VALGSKRISRLRARTKVQSAAKAAIATRAVAYLRVSTEEQASTGHGLESQDRAVRAFAESQGYELVDVVSDPGISGATRPAGRPGFGRILELARERLFTVLLVYKFDRLAREIRYAVTTVSELGEQHDVVIRSVTEPIDTATPMGRTLFAILAGMAENERHVITERTKGGRVMKATKGGFAGGAAPYGYRKDREGGLLLIESEAKVVRRMLRMRRREKATLQAIASALNADGIASPRGGIWRPGAVSYVLDNPKYRGAVEYLFRSGGAEVHVLEQGRHEAIAA
jgi:site-specific DNA recombinase